MFTHFLFAFGGTVDDYLPIVKNFRNVSHWHITQANNRKIAGKYVQYHVPKQGENDVVLWQHERNKQYYLRLFHVSNDGIESLKWQIIEQSKTKTVNIIDTAHSNPKHLPSKSSQSNLSFAKLAFDQKIDNRILTTLQQLHQTLEVNTFIYKHWSMKISYYTHKINHVSQFNSKLRKYRIRNRSKFIDIRY